MRRVLYLLAVLSGLFSHSAGWAAGNTVVHACTKESLDAYNKLAAKILPRENDFAAMQLGVVEHDALNPLVTVAKAPPQAGPQVSDEFDPSCGLAETVEACSAGAKPAVAGKPTTDSFLNASLCSELSRSGIVAFQIAFTHVSFLVVYRKIGSDWLLVQDWPLNWDAQLTLPGDGTLRIDELWKTSHRTWRWSGKDFRPWKEWHAVFLWNGKEFAETKLNQRGEFPGAKADCSIAAAHKAVNDTYREISGDADLPRHTSDPEQLFKAQRPILRLRCQQFSGGAGAAMALSLADWPSVNDESWVFARKRSGTSWLMLESDSEWKCLEALDDSGFTTIHELLSVEHQPGCPSSGSCFRHDRWQWNGKRFTATKTWFSGPHAPSSINSCSE